MWQRWGMEGHGGGGGGGRERRGRRVKRGEVGWGDSTELTLLERDLVAPTSPFFKTL